MESALTCYGGNYYSDYKAENLLIGVFLQCLDLEAWRNELELAADSILLETKSKHFFVQKSFKS